MTSSWTKFVSECKSRSSAIARSCYLRRTHWFEKHREARKALAEVRRVITNCEARCRQFEQQNGDLRRQVSELQAQLREPRQIELPLGDVPPGQQYGANLIALCVNLARKLGLRPAIRALKIFSTG